MVMSQLVVGMIFAHCLVNREEQFSNLGAEPAGHQNQRDHGQQGNDRQLAIAGKHHAQDAQGEQNKARQFRDGRACKFFDRAHILDTARDQLPRLGMVVIGERQVLNVIVHAVAQVVAHMRRHPLRGITVAQAQQRRDKPKSEQKKRRADEVGRVAAQESVIDHRLDHPGDDQIQPGDEQQHQQACKDLPRVRTQKIDSTY